jgi:hypothetical protein
MQPVADLLLDLDRGLAEIGRQFVVALLDARIDIVEGRLDQLVLVADREIAHVGLGRRLPAAAAERDDLEIIFPARPAHMGIEAVERDQSTLGRAKLDRGGHAKPVPVVIEAAIAWDSRMPGRIDGAVVPAGLLHGPGD